MLIRIVRMHFSETGVEKFLKIFIASKEKIRHFPGCKHLQLLKDPTDPLCYTTLSHWEKAEDLENYRKSQLFDEVWGSVKPLFAKRTQAFSLEQYIEL